MKLKSLSVCSIFTLLSACGGGSSDGPSGPANIKNGASSDFLSGRLLAYDRCRNDVPDTDALVLVHNDDFSVRSSHKPDSDGNFQIDISGSEVTFTVLSKEIYAGEPQSLRMRTVLKSPVTNVGDYRTYDELAANGQCECTTVDYSLNVPAEVNNDRSFLAADVSGKGVSTISGGNVGSLRVCRNQGSSWPDLYVTTQYRAPLRGYSTVVSDYNPSNPLNIHLEQLAETVDVQINIDNLFNLSIVSANVSGERRLFEGQSSDMSSVQFVDDPNAEYYLIEADTTDFNDQVRYISYPTIAQHVTRYFSGKPSGTVDLSFEDKRGDMINAVENVAENNAGDYDFSAVSGDFLRFTMFISGLNYNRFVAWEFIGDRQGSLSGIENFSLENIDFSIENRDTPSGSVYGYWDVLDDSRYDGFNDYMRRRNTNISWADAEIKRIYIGGSIHGFFPQL